MSNAGNFCLLVSAISAIATILAQKQYKKYFLGLAIFAVVAAFLVLLLAFITSDFSVKNVFVNSSTINPLIFKIAAAWASHEGSMLLYIAMLAVISSLYAFTSGYSQACQSLQLNLLAFILLLFLCFVFFTSNPFDYLRFTPAQGLGLNPTLQDKALSIHPPMLYLGYVGYIATYVNGILLLVYPEERKAILKNNWQFSNIALLALTTGIGLGAWWAYRELGWGGYWYFDPVENVSLIIWLAGISLHHFLSVSAKTDKFLLWTIGNSLAVFLLSLFGICLVRSGIMSSVHSFAFSAERGLYLFIISLLLSFIGFITFLAKRNNYLKRNIPATKLQKVILVGNNLWLCSAAILITAIIYPIYYSFKNQIDVAIDPAYFYKVFIPVFIPLLIIAASILYFYKTPRFFFAVTSMISIAISMVAILTLKYYGGEFGIITAIISFSAVFLMAQMFFLALKKSTYFQKSLNQKIISMALGHFSLGLLAFTISANIIFSKEIEFIGRVGDKINVAGFNISLASVKFSDGVNYYRQIAEFDIRDNNGNVVTLKPENRLYKIENSVSQETDIYSYLTHDVYAVLSKINGDTIHALIHYRPMMQGIWLSLFLIVISFLINPLSGSKKNAKTSSA